MRLLRLSANKKSFRTVEFKRTGCSLVLGTEGRSKNRKGRTYNGVGKSLMVTLVNFCLGSRRNQELERGLPGWVFHLDIEHGGLPHRITRSINDAGKIALDDVTYRLKEFHELMGPRVFDLPTPIPGLGFRSLASCFARPGRHAYTSLDPIPRSTPHQALLRAIFLLGLDVERVTRKRALKVERDEIKRLKKNLSTDPVIKDFFLADASVTPLERAARRRNQDEEVNELREKLEGDIAVSERASTLAAYTSSLQKLQTLERADGRIDDYENLTRSYDRKIDQLRDQMKEEDVLARESLKKSHNVMKGNEEIFTFLTEQFYDSRPGHLKVRTNEGDNQIRFDLDVHITDDAADGIHEVKVFCYDLMLMTRKHRHSMEFVLHDSRLFSDIDKRQRATLFKVAHAITNTNGLQYLATMNQDQLDSMRDQFTEEEYHRLFENRIVLRLTDDSPKGKLLGVQVGLDPSAHE